MKLVFQWSFFLTFVVIIVFGGTTGCSTPDPENTSARPWSQPRSWEHGLPTNIMEGR
ncbi:MAG: hypothetical protein HOH33_00425 [Verrucomicrobia bacterium]|jgi:hypothetical protein|nr:hypothetical protein [Verrucomicrobiota bacterium]